MRYKRKRKRRKEKKRKEMRRKGKRKNGKRRTCCNQFLLIILYTVYLNYVEVAGLDYEKVWYKVLGQVIYHWRAKQWNLKLYFWNYKKKT